MSTVMDDLHRDHSNVREMLRLLERELGAVSDLSGGDFELMRDIMVYMTRYPDHTHHPKEDLMFGRMRDRGVTADIEHTIAKLVVEHEALAQKGSAFRDMLIGVVDGALVERDTLVEKGRDYAGFLSYHADLEDGTVFLESARLLDDADWCAIEQAFLDQLDPVFGPIVQHEFDSLIDHIRTLSES